MPGPQARPEPVQPPQSEAARPSDDWKQYEVRKQPTDWKSYEIPGQPPSARRMDDVDVESALSSLKEVAGAAEQPPAAQPVNADANPESTWSMEDLRRNLTNITKDEGNQG